MLSTCWSYGHRGFKIIIYSRIWSIICKGPKNRFPLPIHFKSCGEEIAGALQEFCNWWYNREHVESDALNSWKLNILRLLMVEFHFIATIYTFYFLSLNSFLVIWRKGSRNSIGGLFWHLQIRLLSMLWPFEKKQDLSTAKTYEHNQLDETSIIR